MRRTFLRLGLIILFFLFIFGALNYQWLWVNIRYWLRPSSATFQKPGSQTESQRMEPNQLVIASLQIEAPIQYVSEKSEEVFQMALNEGVVHYPETAKPGQFGNVYIFGHSSDYAFSPGKYKTVFALLPKISVGERVTVSDEQGLAHTYIVKETKIVSPDDTSVLVQPPDKKLLTLQTSYPIGTALKRFLVICELEYN
jgi:sortase A